MMETLDATGTDDGGALVRWLTGPHAGTERALDRAAALGLGMKLIYLAGAATATVDDRGNSTITYRMGYTPLSQAEWDGAGGRR